MSRETADLLMNWLRQIGCVVGLISGQKSISAMFSEPTRKPVRILDIDRYGKVWVGLGNLVGTPAFPDEISRGQVLQRLRAVSSLRLSPAEKYPSFPLDDLARTATWVGFQALVNGIVAQLRTDPT